MQRPRPWRGRAADAPPAALLTSPSTASARAVDILCRPQYGALAGCLRGAGGDASKCLPEVVQFDICTEAF